MRILVTGGAGFVGATLALAFKAEHPDATVTALDNLRRRGSELGLGRLREGKVAFLHGDIRNPDDIRAAGAFDLLVECSAEPSAHAGYDGSAAYVIDTNLVGTVNCLEAARTYRATVLFISSSRVYPIEGLRGLPLVEADTRLVIKPGAHGPGWSAAGIARNFPLDGPRTLYGATKLCSELLIQEYAAAYGMRAVVNRCGVLAGPWQMGKVDQGVIVLWAARHLFGGSLSYLGFGGKGTQVRDVLHVRDLFDLLRIQVGDIDRHAGKTYNAGGGHERSVSLLELTRHCQSRSGSTVTIGSDPATRPADVPYYVTDNAEVTAATGWRPSRSVDTLMDEVFAWLQENRQALVPILA